MPMKPTREYLIKSIKSYYSNSESHKKEKTPKQKPMIKNKTKFFETPKLLSNKGSKKEDNLPTPIYNPYSSSYTSSVQSRSPSPLLVLPTVKNSCQNKYPQKKNHQFMLMIFIILSICLILFILFMFVL